MKCPICGAGELKKVNVEESMFGEHLGIFPAEKCTRCNETFTNSVTTKKIEEAAKEKGVWGLSATTKITKAGNSLAVRIPKKIADYLKLKDGQEAYMHPEKLRLIIERKG